MGIVVLGSVFVDIKGYPTNQFNPTGRNVGRIEQVHGGVSRNVVEDIANLELRPKFVSLVDDSGTGDDVIRKLNNHKVDTTYVKKIQDGMGTWLAVFDTNGDVAASISKRPDLAEIDNILDEFGDEIFKDADSIIVEIDMERPTLKRVFAYAEKYNIDVFAVVSNMSIAIEKRDFLQRTACIVCNIQEAGILFQAEYTGLTISELEEVFAKNTVNARIPRLVVTLGAEGAIYADLTGEHGYVQAIKVNVVDTTGAGDSFFAGVAVGLTYGKSLVESCEIGTRLAASVICTTDNVCPRFHPNEFNILHD